MCFSPFKGKFKKKMFTWPLSFSIFLLSIVLFIPQGRPYICRQLPDSYSTWHRVCGIQHRRVICCQCVDHGQWSQSAGRSCGCCQVPSCSSFPVIFGLKQESLPDWSTLACGVVIYVSFLLQALAGFRLFDHLRNRKTRHAKAAGSGLVVSAQLPSWHCLLLWWPGPRPAQTQGQLPQVPDRGQTGRKEGLRGGGGGLCAF